MSTDFWVELDSFAISAAAYDRDTSTLKIKFPKGDIWSYEKVTYSTFKGLLHASSSGSYLRKEIIPKHKGIKIDGPQDSHTPKALQGSPFSS